MPDPTLQELLQELQQQAQPSANHQALIQALKNYNDKTAGFRETRGRGQLPLVTDKDKTALMALHKAIRDAAEPVLEDGNEPAPLREIVRKITGLAAGNYNALQEYDPKKPKTLASLEEDVRALTLHQGDVLLGGADALGGAQSERAPLSFLDGKGNRVSGVFTKKKTLDPEQLFREAVDKLQKDVFYRFSKDREALDWMKENFCRNVKRAYDIKKAMPDEYDPAQETNTAMAALLQKTAGVGEDGEIATSSKRLMELGAEIMRLGSYPGQPLSKEAWKALAKNMSPMVVPVLTGSGVAKIPFGGRVDQRNSAMSTVADLLGMPNVIARAKPMRIIDRDGTVIEGTFMEAAKGMDPRNLPPEARNLRQDCDVNTNGKGFKDLANLQILDYICGNNDRHEENIFYQFDKNGKFCGVQGIDNDSAFGTLDVSKETRNKLGRNYKFLTNLGNMKVIPADTAKRVQALDENTLKYALRGYGLSEAELQAAGKRLRDLQAHLKKSLDLARDSKLAGDRKTMLHVLSDSDFKKCSFKKLGGEAYDFDRGIGNTFNFAGDMVKSLPQRVEQQEKEFKRIEDAVEVGMDNRAERHVPGRERVKGSNLETLLNKRTWSLWTSPNYEKMETAVKEYVRCYKAVEDRLNRTNDEELKRRSDYRHEKEAVVSERDLERMREASEKMRQAAVTYLEGKMPDFNEYGDLDGAVDYPRGASDYTKRRIDAAIQVLKVAKQGCEIKPVERQTAQDNLRQAEAAQQKRQRERSPEGIIEPAQGGHAVGS